MKEEKEKKRKAEDDNINVVDRVKIAREERTKEKKNTIEEEDPLRE